MTHYVSYLLEIIGLVVLVIGYRKANRNLLLAAACCCGSAVPSKALRQASCMAPSRPCGPDQPSLSLKKPTVRLHASLAAASS
jgi:hypothetical protein